MPSAPKETAEFRKAYAVLRRKAGKDPARLRAAAESVRADTLAEPDAIRRCHRIDAWVGDGIFLDEQRQLLDHGPQAADVAGRRPTKATWAELLQLMEPPHPAHVRRWATAGFLHAAPLAVLKANVAVVYRLARSHASIAVPMKRFLEEDEAMFHEVWTTLLRGPSNDVAAATAYMFHPKVRPRFGELLDAIHRCQWKQGTDEAYSMHAPTPVLREDLDGLLAVGGQGRTLVESPPLGPAETRALIALANTAARDLRQFSFARRAPFLRVVAGSRYVHRPTAVQESVALLQQDAALYVLPDDPSDWLAWDYFLQQAGVTSQRIPLLKQAVVHLHGAAQAPRDPRFYSEHLHRKTWEALLHAQRRVVTVLADTGERAAAAQERARLDGFERAAGALGIRLEPGP